MKTASDSDFVLANKFDPSGIALTPETYFRQPFMIGENVAWAGPGA